MSSRVFGALRRQPVAFVALFFALGGSAVAGTKYLTASDQITKGDLAGSTYGDPLIAGGAVTNGKLANPSLRISAGTGLTGGGSVALGGSTTLNVDPTAVQSRVSGNCSSGSAISAVNQDGSVGCQTTGLQLTTTSGNPGPTLGAAGTYFVDVEARVDSSSSSLSGFCAVQGKTPHQPPGVTGVGGAFAQPGGQEASYSFSGMVVVPSEAVPATLSLGCLDTAGNVQTPTNVQWWVSPVGS